VARRAICGRVVYSVTVEAGTHLERLPSLGLHFDFVADITVADCARLGNIMRLGQFLTVDSIFDRNFIIGKVHYVRFMNESDMIRKAMNALPVNRRVSIKSRSYFINLFLSSHTPAADILVAE
jgi:hypothetical protein